MCLEEYPFARSPSPDSFGTSPSVFGTDVIVASIQDIFVHEGSAWGNLSEEGNLDRLAVLDLLALLDEDLAGEFAAILSVKGGYTVGFRVVALLERLKSSHEVVSTGDTVGDDSLCDTSSNSTLHNGSHGVHGSDNLGLELGGNVELDLLEEVLGGTETTDNQDVLKSTVLSLDRNNLVPDELQNTVDNRLEALKNLLVGEGHVTLLNASLRELGLNTDINSPLLTVVSEIGLDSDGVMNLEIKKTGLGAEQSGCLRFRDEGQTVIVLVTEEACLNSGSSGGGLSSIVPNGRDSQIVSDVALFSVEDLTQRFLQG
ncbi:hypothetical protein HG531_005291 [Fusarium graminearum]|nr:hypothetical protein HG531_005291 [Fusarium graminearum]